MKKYWAAILFSMATLMAMPVAYAQGVARSVITTGVVDREPVDDLETVPADNDTVYFFTDLRDMQGQTIVHRWMHGEEEIAAVNFDVRGPRWRIWSSKKMLPEWTGNWTVRVENGSGEVLAEKRFAYGSAEEAGMPTEEQAPMTEEAPMAKEAPTTEDAPKMDAPPAVEEQGGTGTAE